jgi:hypothetical protein
MTQLERLRLEMRREFGAVKQRISVLESGDRKTDQVDNVKLIGNTRSAVPRPDDEDMAERDKWAADYVEAEMQYGGGRVNPKRWKSFLADQQEIEVRALHRFLSRIDKRPIRKGTATYILVRNALLDEKAKLENHGPGKLPIVIRVRRTG